MATSNTSPTMTIEVDRSTFDRLTKLSNELNESIDHVLRRAITGLEQSRFIDQVVDDFDSLRNDPVAWMTYSEEFATIDGAAPNSTYS